jgi:hypothetical protein
VTALFKWGRQSDGRDAGRADSGVDERRIRSKVLPRFLGAIAHISAPVLVDLGPVVGPNIAFFGDRLACKIHVEDICAEVEAHAQRRGDRDALRQSLLLRVTHAPGSIDGILCWDVFDSLDRPTSQALAGRLVELLRPGGALYGCFGTTKAQLAHYTRYQVDAEDALRARPYPATPARRDVLTTRDINKMFQGLTIAESVLLKNGSREMLFRKL